MPMHHTVCLQYQTEGSCDHSAWQWRRSTADACCVLDDTGLPSHPLQAHPPARTVCYLRSVNYKAVPCSFGVAGYILRIFLFGLLAGNFVAVLLYLIYGLRKMQHMPYHATRWTSPYQQLRICNLHAQVCNLLLSKAGRSPDCHGPPSECSVKLPCTVRHRAFAVSCVSTIDSLRTATLCQAWGWKPAMLVRF